jgi:hypothetical protein
MSYTPTWSSREKFEADRRAHAEHMIEHGVGYADEDVERFTDDERAEAERLTPGAIKAVRRECGRIERPLRRAHPEVIWLLHPGVDRYLSGEYDAAMAALSPEALAALDVLVMVRDIRHGISGRHVDPLGYFSWGWEWPTGYQPTEIPEVDRLRAIKAVELTRRRAATCEDGRRLLADLDSGAAWEREVERRADVDEYFRNGPVIRRVKV